MKEKIEQIKQKTLEEIKKVTDLKNLEEIKVKALGKKGELTEVLKGLKDLAQEERPKVGAWVNEAKASVEEFINKREEEFKAFELNKKLENEKIDITLPGNKFKRGSIHPLNRVIEDMEDLFVSMGYDVVEGPELETDEFCFERLNVPKGHPARDMQDSFYITEENLLRSLKDLAAEERPIIGNLVNDAKETLERLILEKEEELKKEELNKKLESEKIDITLPGNKLKRGSMHPLNRVIEDIEDLFVSMGYDVVEGPELETDEFCFERLNLPKGHPARDMQDSFYITDEYLLRTQTSSVQARVMIANEEKGPLRIITLGKTYRREDDATHSHQFNQIEGLVIDKKEVGVSLADLKGTLEIFVRKIIGANLDLRFRPSYFPFTEPSYEVDVTCFKCGGKGCNLCKQTGWIELLGSGIVHPNVLKMNGYDPEKYGGFAFGTGIDRLAMFRYGITDMRYLYTNDVRFLTQFDRKDED